MTALVSATEVREHIDTDLPDSAVERAIESADADIVRRFGAHTTAITEVFTTGTADVFLFTQRPISAITSVTESQTGIAGEDTDVLVAADYEHMGGSTLRRREGGDNPRVVWAPRVTVVYTPVSDNARRIMATIQLVRVDLAYEALKAISVGDVSVTHVEYRRERESILSALDTNPLGAFA